LVVAMAMVVLDSVLSAPYAQDSSSCEDAACLITRRKT